MDVPPATIAPTAGPLATALWEKIAAHDPETGRHCLRVAAYAAVLGGRLGLAGRAARDLYAAALVHDFGKLAVPATLLNKPGPLTDREFDEVKRHAALGAGMLEKAGAPAATVAVARWHHERWDGHGYPDRLAGEHTPLAARIIAVADAFDAMTADRPYRRGMSPEVAFTRLAAAAGEQFDPECVRAFLAARRGPAVGRRAADLCEAA